MKGITVRIKGISALLMNAFPLEEREGLEKAPAEEQAMFHAYKTDDKFFVPGVNIQRALVAAATFSKGTGKGKASLQKPVAACVLVTPERLVLGKDGFVLDTRAVVIPATRGRILRHRLRWDDWTLGFDLEYDERLLSEPQMRRIVDDAGSRVGILDFRPEKKGPFGRFVVTEWKR